MTRVLLLLALKEYYRDGPLTTGRSSSLEGQLTPRGGLGRDLGPLPDLYDALETASAQGLSQGIRPPCPWRSASPPQSLSIAINEVNRSIGRGDAYPFVISPAVAAKLEFVDRVIARLRTHW